MITIKENTTLAGVSELRYGIEKILERTQEGLSLLKKDTNPQLC